MRIPCGLNGQATANAVSSIKASLFLPSKVQLKSSQCYLFFPLLMLNDSQHGPYGSVMETTQVPYTLCFDSPSFHSIQEHWQESGLVGFPLNWPLHATESSCCLGNTVFHFFDFISGDVTTKLGKVLHQVYLPTSKLYLCSSTLINVVADYHPFHISPHLGALLTNTTAALSASPDVAYTAASLANCYSVILL